MCKVCVRCKKENTLVLVTTVGAGEEVLGIVCDVPKEIEVEESDNVQ